MGQAGYEQIWTGFFCPGDSRKEEIAFSLYPSGNEGQGRRYISSLRRPGYRHEHAPADWLAGRPICCQFTRFFLYGGRRVLCRRYAGTPVPSLIMPHFVDRFNIQPFILHDKTHHVAGVFDRKEWVIASAEGALLPDSSADQRAWERMWKAFYDTIAIREQGKSRCRMNHMPKNIGRTWWK